MKQWLADTICPGCGELDPQCDWIDFGIGPYEYWGACGVHRQLDWVTTCCEAAPEEFWPEPNPNHLYESDLA